MLEKRNASVVVGVCNVESGGAAAVDKVVKENMTINNKVKLSSKLASCVNEGRR